MIRARVYHTQWEMGIDTGAGVMQVCLGGKSQRFPLNATTPPNPT